MPTIRINENAIDEFFGHGGVLENKIEGFEIRDAQINMAKEVLSCFSLGGLSLIEAGTGVGKSYAYLYPAILLALESKKAKIKQPVVVATSSITLQNQLFEKDLPRLFEYLNLTQEDIKYSLLLGRNNYLCWKRFEDYRKNNSLFMDNQALPDSVLLNWAKTTLTGLKREIQDSIMKTEWNSVCSDSDLCLGFNRCPYALKCFYFKAQHEALSSAIIVTNQHVLALDAKIRWEHNEGYDEAVLLPPFQHLVIDEAHNFREIARKIMSEEYEGESINLALSTLFKKKSDVDNSKLNMVIKALGIKSADFLKQFAKYNKELKEQNKKVIIELEKLINDKKLDLGVNFNPLKIEEYKALFCEAESLNNTLFEFCKELDKLSRDYDALDLVNNDCLQALNFASQRLFCLSSALTSLVNLGTDEDNIIYLEDLKDKRYIKISPSDIGPTISNTMFDHISSVVCTSATISTNKNFNYFINNLNLAHLDPTCEIYQSPFDYKKNMRILVPEKALSYNINNEEEFKSQIKETIKKGIIASKGGALVLFTSYKMMNDVYSELKKEPFAKQFKLFCQDKENSKTEVLNRFKRNVNSSLFAVASFWEGVDIPGDSLRLVIITKLPFLSPADPIYNGMSLLQKRNGGTNSQSLFYSHSLPSTIISTKQGIGRLIRSTKDRGIVVFLDNRILTKPYSKQILNSLPVPVEKSSDIEADIETFFN